MLTELYCDIKKFLFLLAEANGVHVQTCYELYLFRVDPKKQRTNEIRNQEEKDPRNQKSEEPKEPGYHKPEIRRNRESKNPTNLETKNTLKVNY